MMPVKEATEKNVTMIPGGAGQETLENAAVLILAGMERNDRATTR
ncbi:disulfide bond formation protein DsbA, partial [Salmonella enterica subsp. enterica serovar Typhimurium]|nr:disulfide bond formation protein DsbA [Salmonella enterica subsp. enterica serovar Typhimurium]